MTRESEFIICENTKDISFIISELKYKTKWTTWDFKSTPISLLVIHHKKTISFYPESVAYENEKDNGYKVLKFDQWINEVLFTLA